MGYAMSTAPIRSDWVGRVIDGRFTLLQWLGGAGRSGVFLTELPGGGSEKAAIKLIGADAQDAEALMAGGVPAATLSHPHLIRMIETGRCQFDTIDLLYAVMEYGDEVLSEILLERALTPVETREMLEPVLDALSYLHGKGLVHGRLKPSNILAVDNQLKISSDSLQAAGKLSGRLPAQGVYDAPEAALEAISPAADVWSLGVTLVEALTQHPPIWDASTDGDPTVPESIPQPFAEIARECLRRDPARRCTFRDVGARLAPAPPLPEPARETDKKAPGKFRLTAVIVAAVVLIAAIAAMQLRSHLNPSSPPTGTQQPEPAIAAPQAESPAAETQTAKGATVKGAVAERALPDVPISASESIRGKVDVRIRVSVDASGAVSDASVDSPGTSKYFANLAVQTARRWRFEPAQVDGQAVPSRWILEFEFRPNATAITPVEASP